MFLIKLPFLPLKILFALIGAIGVSRVLALGIGIAIGMVIAPTTGAELRAQLQERIQGADPTAAPV